MIKFDLINLQMAQNSREEEAMARMLDHTMVSSKAKRRSFVKLMSRLIFPQEGTTGAQTRWITRQSITRVTVWGQDHLLNNLWLAVIREAMGLGPHHCCKIRSMAPNFESKVLLLARYLPRERLSIRPIGPPLGGPFLQPHWRSLGEEISQRITPIMGELPPMCPRCYSRWCGRGICLALRQAKID